MAIELQVMRTRPSGSESNPYLKEEPIEFNKIPQTPEQLTGSRTARENCKNLSKIALEQLKNGNLELRVAKDRHIYVLDLHTNSTGLKKYLLDLWNFMVKCYQEGVFSNKDLVPAEIRRALEDILTAGVECSAYNLATKIKGPMPPLNGELDTISKCRQLCNALSNYFSNKSGHQELTKILTPIQYHLDALSRVPDCLEKVRKEKKKENEESLLREECIEVFRRAYTYPLPAPAPVLVAAPVLERAFAPASEPVQSVPVAPVPALPLEPELLVSPVLAPVPVHVQTTVPVLATESVSAASSASALAVAALAPVPAPLSAPVLPVLPKPQTLVPVAAPAGRGHETESDRIQRPTREIAVEVNHSAASPFASVQRPAPTSSSSGANLKKPSRKAEVVFPAIKTFLTPPRFQKECIEKLELETGNDLILVPLQLQGELTKIETVIKEVETLRQATDTEKKAALNMVIAQLTLIECSIAQAKNKVTNQNKQTQTAIASVEKNIGPTITRLQQRREQLLKTLSP